MRLEFDKNGYVCCILYGCMSGACVEYTGSVPTQPEEYKDIDDWANRAQTNAYYLDSAGNLAYDSSKAVSPDDSFIDTSGSYFTDEVLTGSRWIDGKPIYRRTFEYAITKTGTECQVATIASFGTLVDIKGTFHQSNGRWLSANFYFSDTYYAWARVADDGKVECLSGGRTGTMYITVEYTKTTGA